MNPIQKRKQKQKNREYMRNLSALMLFFPLSTVYLELVVHLRNFGRMSGTELANVFFLSFSFGALISVILSMIRNRTALRITAIALSGVTALLLGSQMIYFEIFQSYFGLEATAMAGDAVTQFSGNMFETIGKNFFYVILLCLPTVLIAVFNKRITYFPIKRLPPILTYFVISVMGLSFIIGSMTVNLDSGDLGSKYFYKHHHPTESAKRLGVITSLGIDLKNIIFGEREEVAEVESGMNDIENPFVSDSGSDGETTGGSSSGDTTGGGESTPPVTDPPPPPIDYGYNILENINLSSTKGTIGKINNYVKSLEPTKKNQYTGMFEGYNLIYLTLEGFSGKVINPNLTPTLYMMANSGFVFENYYHGAWGGSTSTGEYANLTGNFYGSPECMRTYVPKTYQPFALGNQLKELGYTTKAYHAWTYTYYNRDKSHPSLGYEWIAHNKYDKPGYTGLDVMKDENGNGMKFPWVPSDYDTARITVNDFINEEPFHVYYMTISGHTNYNWTGNAMCKKHRAEINAYCKEYGLSYSEEVKAYLACQLEVELMLEYLVDKLEAAGKLDNTVFVMSNDHYPYGLSDESLAELYGLPVKSVRGNFETYRSSLIIWNSQMKAPVKVDTPCSVLDILPTVSNLFGLEYDSRLMAGVDVLSGAEPVVIINFDGGYGSWNWITRYGSYMTSTKTFTPTEGFSASEDAIKTYVADVNALVKAQRTYIPQMLENDYYAYVFGKK